MGKEHQVEYLFIITMIYTDFLWWFHTKMMFLYHLKMVLYGPNGVGAVGKFH